MAMKKNQQTHIARRIDEADEKARYDRCAKNILADKTILAYIFRDTIAEVRGRPIEEIREMIEGTPLVGSASPKVSGGAGAPEAITGMDTSDKTMSYGEVDYDILAWLTPHIGQDLRRIIIDIEPQEDYHPGCHLVTRGVYYAARRLARQKDTEFTDDNYCDLKKVYSIWICTDAPKKYRGTITDHSLCRTDLAGVFTEEEYYDLMSVVLIRIGGEPENYEQGSLQHMLSILFSETLPADKKKEILERQCDIPMTVKIGKEIDAMGGLGEGIERRGIKKGVDIGEKRKQENCIQALMRNLNLTRQQAMSALDIVDDNNSKSS